MAANRRVSILAGVTGVVALACILLLAIDPVPVDRPPTVKPDLPEPEIVAPEIVGDLPPEPAPAARLAKPSTKEKLRERRPVARTVPLTVQVIDGETGRTLDGARPTLVLPGDKKVLLVASGELFRLDESPIRVGKRIALDFEVELPWNYSLEAKKRFRVISTICRFADRVRVTIPAWPDAQIQVRVVDHRGDPVAGASVTQVTCAGNDGSWLARPTDNGGWTKVKHIPAFRGEIVRVYAGLGDRGGIGSTKLIGSRSLHEITVVLPEHTNLAIGLGGGAGGSFSDRVSRRRLRTEGTGVVTVLVRHRDGKPAVDTLVSVRGKKWGVSDRTDAAGRVTLKGFHPEELKVWVSEAGYLMGDPVKITLEEGKPATVTIHEAEPGWAAALVLDEEGNGLPSARVSLEVSGGVPYVFLDRGMQYLNVLSGPDGRIVFPNVPPQAFRIRAYFCSRRGSVKIIPDGIAELKLGKNR